MKDDTVVEEKGGMFVASLGTSDIADSLKPHLDDVLSEDDE